MTEHRLMKAEFAVWFGIFGNVSLAILKGVAGFLSGSKSLIADAAHSATDAAGSTVALLGLKAVKLPSGKERGHDHGKSGTTASIIVSLLSLVVGVEVGLSAVKAIYHGVDQPPDSYKLALAVIVFSILAKEVMFQYKFRLGKKLSNQALMANAWEHRSDVYPSIAALFGVGGALVGGYYDYPVLYYLDPVAGLFITVLVLRMGVRFAKDSFHRAPDRVLHEEDAKQLHEAVERVKGVISVDGLSVREHGHYLIVDVQISVDPRITVHEGHDIAKMTKHYLMSRFSNVCDACIKVNPYDPGYPYKGTVDDGRDDVPTILH